MWAILSIKKKYQTSSLLRSARYMFESFTTPYDMAWISALAFWCKAVLILPSPIKTYECMKSAGGERERERDRERERERYYARECGDVNCFIFRTRMKVSETSKEHSAIPISSSKLYSVSWWRLCYITTPLTNIQRKKEGKKERQNKFINFQCFTVHFSIH